MVESQPTHHTLLSYKKGERATLRNRVSILSDEAAQQFWDDQKKRQVEQKRAAATPS